MEKLIFFHSTSSIFDLTNPSFALLNPLHVKNIPSVLFSKLELNKKLSKTNLYLHLLYFVNCGMTLLAFKEMLIGYKQFSVSTCNPRIFIVPIISNILHFSPIVLFFFEHSKPKLKTLSLTKVYGFFSCTFPNSKLMLVLYVSFLLQTLNYYWDLSDLTFHCLYFHQKNMSNHLLKIICLTL